MVSIITAIYNQLGMNRVFLDSVRNSTLSDWELIVIDNGSTDGSAEFFENAGPNVKVIRNDGNYSYPYCQNRGIEEAQGDTLAFLNNDILLPYGWDRDIMEVLGKDGYEVLTLASNDNTGSRQESKQLNRRYKRVKYPLMKLFGAKPWVLRLMARLTYGNFDKFARKHKESHQGAPVPGFAGSAVIWSRRALEIFKIWDPTMQGADFDLFYRTLRRAEEYGDIKPMSVVPGVYHHHYSRLTFRSSFPEYRDIDIIRPIESKWSREEMESYNQKMRTK